MSHEQLHVKETEHVRRDHLKSFTTFYVKENLSFVASITVLRLCPDANYSLEIKRQDMTDKWEKLPELVIGQEMKSQPFKSTEDKNNLKEPASRN